MSKYKSGHEGGVKKYLAYVLEQIDNVAVEDLLPYSENLPTHSRMTVNSA